MLCPICYLVRFAKNALEKVLSQRGCEKFSGGLPTEAKNPKNKKK